MPTAKDGPQRSRSSGGCCRASLALLAASVGALLLSAAAPPSAGAFELSRKIDGSLNTISPQYCDPVEVVLWVNPNVSAADEAWVTGEIQAGLDLWEGVPTSSIRFTTSTVHQATEPSVPGKLLIVVANSEDITSGGASLPASGQPGTWFGAVADGPHTNAFRFVAAHEVGHAVGIVHSSVGSNAFGANNIPVMHWSTAGQTGLTEDDAAATSVAYPEPGNPLSATTGTIRGSVTDPSTPGYSVDGVNVVAVDHSTGKPTVGALTGENSLITHPGGGTFDLVGLPAGTYDLRYLDGTSFAGSIYGSYYDRRVQIDNFEPYSSGPWTVSAGQVINLSSSQSQVTGGIEPLSIDRIGIGDRNDNSGIDVSNETLPPAIAGQPYDVWLRLRGGARPLSLAASGITPGLGLSVTLVDSSQSNSDFRGRAWIHVSGVPNSDATVGVSADIQDDRGASQSFGFHTGPAQVSVQGNKLKYFAPAGQANDVSVAENASNFEVRDYKTPLRAVAPCTSASWKQVTCPATGVSGVDVDVGDRDDDVTINGSTGSTIRGGAGDDTLRGGWGPDTFDGGPGSDTFTGLGGTDWVSYASRTSRVVADTDGVRDDGTSGEQDNLESGIEGIWGGSANDKLSGGDEANLLIGGAGPDELIGGGGNDLLVDGIWIFGGTDADILKGGPGTDLLLPGLGDDTLIGGPDHDVMNGAAGDDSIYARDNAPDVATCADGDDSAQVDPLDTTSGCESLSTANVVASVADGVLYYSEFDGHAGNLAISKLGSIHLMSDPGAIPIVGPGCAYVFGFLGCDGVANGGDGTPVSRVYVDAGDGADSVDATFLPTKVDLHGGAGDDELLGGNLDDTIDGGSENDAIVGGEGEDALDGGPGDDQIDSRDTATYEEVQCGAGSDIATVDLLDSTIGCETVEAPPRSVPLVFSWDGRLRYLAPAGQQNQVSIYTNSSQSGDVQIVEDAASAIMVGPGCALLNGAAMCDGIVNAGDGAPIEFITATSDDQDDWVVADATVRSELYGGDGNDILSSGSTPGDWVEGGPGSDVMMSGAGSDVIVGQDGEDDGLIHCGGDAAGDVVLLDPLPLDANLSQCGSSSIFR